MGCPNHEQIGHSKRCSVVVCLGVMGGLRNRTLEVGSTQSGLEVGGVGWGVGGAWHEIGTIRPKMLEMFLSVLFGS